jgi:hypothetical protein
MSQRFFYCEFRSSKPPVYREWFNQIIAHCQLTIHKTTIPHLSFFRRSAGKFGCIIHYHEKRTARSSFVDNKGQLMCFIPAKNTLSQSMYHGWRVYRENRIEYRTGKLQDQAIIEEIVRPEHKDQTIAEEPSRLNQTDGLKARGQIETTQRLDRELGKGEKPSKIIHTLQYEVKKVKGSGNNIPNEPISENVKPPMSKKTAKFNWKDHDDEITFPKIDEITKGDEQFLSKWCGEKSEMETINDASTVASDESDLAEFQIRKTRCEAYQTQIFQILQDAQAELQGQLEEPVSNESVKKKVEELKITCEKKFEHLQQVCEQSTNNTIGALEGLENFVKSTHQLRKEMERQKILWKENTLQSQTAVYQLLGVAVDNSKIILNATYEAQKVKKAALDQDIQDLQTKKSILDHDIETRIGRKAVLDEHIKTCEDIQALERTKSALDKNIEAREAVQSRLNNSIEDQKSKESELDRKIRIFEETIKTHEAKESGLNQSIHTLEGNIAELNQNLSLEEAKKTAMNSCIQRLNEDKSALDKHIQTREAMKSELDQVINGKKSEIDQLTKTQNSEMDRLMKTQEEKQSEIDQLTKTQEEKQSKIDQLTKTQNQKESEIELLMKTQEEKQSEIDHLTKTQEEKQSKIDQLTKTQNQKESEIELLMKTQNQKQSEIHKLEKIREQKKIEIDQLETAQEEKQSEINKLMKIQEENLFEIDKLIKTQDRLKSGIDQLKKAHQEFDKKSQSLDQEVKTRKQERSQLDKNISRRQAKISELKQNFNTANIAMANLKDQCDNLTRSFEEKWNVLENEIAFRFAIVQEHQKSVVDHDTIRAIRLKATKRLEFDFEIQNERELRMFNHTKTYDVLFDANKINDEICDQMLIDYQMALVENVDCMTLATGLSGTGKTLTCFDKDSGILFSTLEKLFTPGIKIRACQVDLVKNKVNDLSYEKEAIAKGWGWRHLEGMQASTYSEMKAILSSALSRRDTRQTKNNDTSSRTHCLIQYELPILLNKKTGETKWHKFMFADLAGYEGAETGPESSSINKSLQNLRQALQVYDSGKCNLLGSGFLEFFKPYLNRKGTKKIYLDFVSSEDVAATEPKKVDRVKNYWTNTWGLVLKPFIFKSLAQHNFIRPYSDGTDL